MAYLFFGYAAVFGLLIAYLLYLGRRVEALERRLAGRFDSPAGGA